MIDAPVRGQLTLIKLVRFEAVGPGAAFPIRVDIDQTHGANGN
jgi:hypothetical protein